MFSLPRFQLPATQFRRTIASLAASSGMHAVRLTTLAVVVVNAQHPSDSPQPHPASLALPTSSGTLDGAAIDGSLSGATAPQHADRVALSDDVATPGARFPLSAAVFAEIDPVGLLPPELGSIERLERPSLQAERDSGPALKRRLSAANTLASRMDGGGKVGDGKGAGAGTPSGAGHSFFGLEATGKKVVFVVDISGSMSGRRFFRTRNELRRSIESLRENQQFFFVFFSDDALPMPAEKLLPATRENVYQTLQWLDDVQCGGGTNPLSGILLALQLHPDAIYLLTDGKFEPQVVLKMTQAGPLVPIPI